ncbi:hypothetical protein M5D96_013991 [Drosophila gunungcola]|uniref:Uncharacterized protein n=1 Tax=Drosophila gunungcola TaxID=103775 RepID=A0A9P9YA79_9MUSC|nr:hypothetical protein M5D96_013991 [Drosophila gunungcola]
MRWLAVRCDQS